MEFFLLRIHHVNEEYRILIRCSNVANFNLCTKNILFISEQERKTIILIEFKMKFEKIIISKLPKRLDSNFLRFFICISNILARNRKFIAIIDDTIYKVSMK